MVLPTPSHPRSERNVTCKLTLVVDELFEQNIAPHCLAIEPGRTLVQVEIFSDADRVVMGRRAKRIPKRRKRDSQAAVNLIRRHIAFVVSHAFATTRVLSAGRVVSFNNPMDCVVLALSTAVLLLSFSTSPALLFASTQTIRLVRLLTKGRSSFLIRLLRVTYRFELA